MIFKMTETEFLDHVEENDGICVACGEIQTGGVEPDASGYICEACGRHRVRGFELALMAGDIEFIDEEE